MSVVAYPEAPIFLERPKSVNKACPWSSMSTFFCEEQLCMVRNTTSHFLWATHTVKITMYDVNWIGMQIAQSAGYLFHLIYNEDVSLRGVDRNKTAHTRTNLSVAGSARIYAMMFPFFRSGEMSATVKPRPLQCPKYSWMWGCRNPNHAFDSRMRRCCSMFFSIVNEFPP